MNRIFRQEKKIVSKLFLYLLFILSSILYLEKDECESNPCLNNGTCIDAEAGFWCECKHGWKGRTCNLSKDNITLFMYTLFNTL